MFRIQGHSFLNYIKLNFSKIYFLIVGQKNLNSLNFLLFERTKIGLQINGCKGNTRQLKRIHPFGKILSIDPGRGKNLKRKRIAYSN